MGLYLYASGVKRQVISVLARFGLSSSYTTIAGSITVEDIVNNSHPSMTSYTPQNSSARTTGNATVDDEEEEELEETINTEDDVGGKESDEVGSEIAEEDVVFLAHTDPAEVLPIPAAQMQVNIDSTQAQAPRDAIEDALEARQHTSCEQAPSNKDAERKRTSYLKRAAGLLRQFCEFCRLTARQRAHEFPCGHVYDNVNWMERVAEQRVARTDTQQAGTCATIFPLSEARSEDMKTADLLQSIDKAPPLALADVLHTPEEAAIFLQSLEHTFLRQLLATSATLARRFQGEVDACLPDKDDCLSLRETEILPLPTMQIDESSIIGNAEVLDTIFKELCYDVNGDAFAANVHPIFGDQLSISRLRTLVASRAGHENLADSYANTAVGPGLFHHQLTFVLGFMETYFDESVGSARNPSSLAFYNTLLGRKPINLTSLPPYRVSRDLVYHILMAAAPVCLEEVAGMQDLDKYTETVTYEQLKEDVSQVFKRIFNPRVISDLRQARHEEVTKRTEQAADPAKFEPFAESEPEFESGDMVFENMALLVRDALILREFNDAIKGGYSGRIIRTLKVLTFMYRGLGRTKYAHESLHIVHNLTHVWPKALRYVTPSVDTACMLDNASCSDIMVNNWLVNPTGRPNSWVPVDLMQEHNNFWTKAI